MKNYSEYKIAIIGLGYVGFPLFSLFSQSFRCIGIDTNVKHIEELKLKCQDSSLSKQLTDNWNDIINSNIYIVAVPTPVDKINHPDVTLLKDVCFSLAPLLSRDDIVIFESTVFPGATEEICIPILEKGSGLEINRDFSVGYSPERINIGDVEHSLTNTPKIISATNEIALSTMLYLYQSVIGNNVISASSIKVAEASKMYENIQRDVLIALANSYSEYCRSENINIYEITRCASSKWNFANVLPGLVGGHCIGVDPYYLIERSKTKGIEMNLVQTAREINENKVVAVKDRIFAYAKKQPNQISSILLLGFTYKKNVADIRNTKIAQLIKLLQEQFDRVDCYDPLINPIFAYKEYGINVLTELDEIHFSSYDLIIKSVDHDIFRKYEEQSVNILDLKSFL